MFYVCLYAFSIRYNIININNNNKNNKNSDYNIILKIEKILNSLCIKIEKYSI